VEGAYGASVRALVAVISELRRQTLALADAVEAGFGRHPDVEIYLSQPGSGRSWAPGCSPSSGMTPPATPPPRRGATTRGLGRVRPRCAA